MVYVLRFKRDTIRELNLYVNNSERVQIFKKEWCDRTFFKEESLMVKDVRNNNKVKGD